MSDVPKEVSEYMASLARKSADKRNKALRGTKTASERAKAAAKARWDKHREARESTKPEE